MRYKTLASSPGYGEFGLAVALLAATSILLMLFLAAPAEAQADDPLADEAAQITESPDDDDEIVDRIVIAVAGCEVADDATITVEDDDGTRAKLTNGQNVDITADADQITIVGTGEGGNLGSIDSTGQFGTEGETVEGAVIRSTGITCTAAGDGDGNGNGGGGNGDGDDTAADGQYDPADNDPTADTTDDTGAPEAVINDTVPDKPLPNTGGAPLVLGAGALLACATLLSARILRP